LYKTAGIVLKGNTRFFLVRTLIVKMTSTSKNKNGPIVNHSGIVIKRRQIGLLNYSDKNREVVLCMSWLWSLIIGGIIGWLAGIIMRRDVPGGVIGNIIAGFIGGWLGSLIFGKMGPVFGGFYFVPALIGSIILIAIVSLLMGRRKA
jgi:uncharacterized membrane protein YeaQ/YmgE (transglycosylase-associated protein family)